MTFDKPNYYLMSNVRHVKSVSHVVSLLSAKARSILEETPCISPDWKEVEEEDSEGKITGWIDNKGIKQGRWTYHETKCQVDYVDGEICTKIIKGFRGWYKLSFSGIKMSEYCELKLGVLDYYSLSLIINDSCYPHGWRYDGHEQCTFYDKGKILVELPTDNKAIDKICLLQRLVRRKTFIRRFLLFSMLKFMPMEILSIINLYQC